MAHTSMVQFFMNIILIHLIKGYTQKKSHHQHYLETGQNYFHIRADFCIIRDQHLNGSLAVENITHVHFSIINFMLKLNIIKICYNCTIVNVRLFVQSQHF